MSEPDSTDEEQSAEAAQESASSSHRNDKKYKVKWPGRLALDKDTILDISVIEIGFKGVKFDSPKSIPKGRTCKIEIIPSVEGVTPIRGVVTVLYTTILNDQRGIVVGTNFSYIPPQYASSLTQALKNFPVG